MEQLRDIRINSTGVGGFIWGDEGKGKITDQIGTDYAKKYPVTIYGPNGGPNAGHTVEANGVKFAFHQLPSGMFIENATVVLGKGKVVHPQDLLEEINQAKEISGNTNPSIKIDCKAVLSLNTHRAFEQVLKTRQNGSKGSTGRGIGPAYADILLRHPLRMRDLILGRFDEFEKHYDLYNDLIKGLDKDVNMATIEVPILGREGKTEVGTKEEFINQLKAVKEKLIPFTEDVYDYINETWKNENKYAYVIELAQATGLDPRWGVYPDVTASDTTFPTITASTEGLINWQEIEHRISIMKATYSSSVGSRKLPTTTPENLASKIRNDANEYGATTNRPRDIVYLDLPALRFFSKVSGANEIGITHMDIVYPDTPIKICTDYQVNGRIVNYRPDQEWLNQVTPIYQEIPTWDRELITRAEKYENIPQEAKDYLQLISKELKLPVTIITNGSKREQTINVTT